MNPNTLLINSLFFILFVWPLSGAAHAFLEHAEPGAGAELAAAPKQVVLTYDRGVEATFSTIQIRNENGNPIETGSVQSNPDNPTQLRLELPPLPPGNYRIFWSIMARDGHRTEGDHTFRIESADRPAP